MRGDVPRPEESIWLQLIDLVGHLEQDAGWNVTLGKCAVGASLLLGIRWVTIFMPATQHVIAVDIASDLVI